MCPCGLPGADATTDAGRRAHSLAYHSRVRTRKNGQITHAGPVAAS